MTVIWAIGRALLVALAVIAVLLLLLWMFQRRLIFFPDRSPVPPAGRAIAGAEDVRLTTSDGLEIGAWFVPARAEPRDMTVLVANGNAGNRAGREPLAVTLSEAGFDVLLFDYRGYSDNPGSPSEEGLSRDARAAHHHLVTDRGVRPDQLLFFGESLGSGVVADLATEHPPAGMLLRSPFVDLPSVGAHHYPFLPARLLLWDRFPVSENVSQLDVPITVVYGTADSVVPPEQSQRVAEAAHAVVERIDGADHNDMVMFAGRVIVDAVIALAERSAER